MDELKVLIDRMSGADAAGRLSGDRAPDFYLLRGADGIVCHCHERLPDDVAERLRTLAAAARGRPRDWPLEYGGYLRLLAEVGPIEAMRAGPLYAVLAPPPSDAVRITLANIDRLHDGLAEWREDVANGALMFAALADGRAVAVCASVRTVEGAHAAGVETEPAYRGYGHASAAVAAWADAVLRLGATPLYGTTFDNLASQSVARRLGMRLVGAEFSAQCDIAPAQLAITR